MIMDYKRMLNKILSSEEYIAIDKDIFHCSDEEILEFLVNIGVVGIYDWKDAEEQTLYNFIDGRMLAMSLSGLEIMGIYPYSASKLYNQIHSNGISNYVSFMLRFYNRVLRKNGMRLLEIDRQDDCHRIIVVRLSNSSRLKSVKSLFWKFRDDF